MGASVGLTPYQESFAVDPNEILRKDHSRFSEDFSARNENMLSHDDARFASQQQQQFVQKFEPSDFIKQESNFSEDEEPMDQKLFQPIKNVNDCYFNNHNNSHNISPLNNNNNNNNNNNKNLPQVIHSANSRLLNCSRMLHLSNSSSFSNGKMFGSNSIGSSQKMIGSDHQNQRLLLHYQQSPSPGSPMGGNSYKRPNNDLHLNVKLVSLKYSEYQKIVTNEQKLLKRISFVSNHHSFDKRAFKID